MPHDLRGIPTPLIDQRQAHVPAQVVVEVTHCMTLPVAGIKMQQHVQDAAAKRAVRGPGSGQAGGEKVVRGLLSKRWERMEER